MGRHPFDRYHSGPHRTETPEQHVARDSTVQSYARHSAAVPSMQRTTPPRNDESLTQNEAERENTYISAPWPVPRMAAEPRVTEMPHDTRPTAPSRVSQASQAVPCINRTIRPPLTAIATAVRANNSAAPQQRRTPRLPVPPALPDQSRAWPRFGQGAAGTAPTTTEAASSRQLQPPPENGRPLAR